MINALKSILVIEFDATRHSREKNIQYLNQMKAYVEREMGVTHYMSYNDPSLVVLVFPSDRLNVQLLNSPYDCWERYEDTLSQKYENIEAFIKTLV